MKLIHTSDLHIGKKLHETVLEDFQREVLSEIKDKTKEYGADGIIVAGDVFDRQLPPSEAVKLYDDFITSLWKETGRPVYMVSGNHDSVDRLSQNSEILSEEEVHISPNFISHGIKKVTETDEYGKLNIFLFPFITPSMVRDRYLLTKTPDWDEAFEMLLSKMEEEGAIDWSERNVAVMHQFITGSERSDSENDVGGVDAVSGSLFSRFDYVALGHLHRPQTVPGDNVMVYSGTPLPYSFSEMNDRKSISLVTIGRKGEKPVVERIPLKQPYTLERLEGKLDDLLDDGRKESIPENTFYSVLLTDDTEPVGALQELRGVYGEILEMRSLATERQLNEIYEAETMKTESERKSPFDMVREFINMMNPDTPLTESGEELLRGLLEEAREAMEKKEVKL